MSSASTEGNPCRNILGGGEAKSEPNDMTAQKTIKARSGLTARGFILTPVFS